MIDENPAGEGFEEAQNKIKRKNILPKIADRLFWRLSISFTYRRRKMRLQRLKQTKL